MILTILILGYLVLNIMVSVHRIKTNYNVIYPLTYKTILFSTILYILIWSAGYSAAQEGVKFRTLTSKEAQQIYGGIK